MKRSNIAGTAAGVLLAVAFVACGSDDDTLSASEYRAQGDKLCRDVAADVQAAVPDSQPTVEAIRRDHAPALERALAPLKDGLEQLRPPANVARDHAQLVSTVESAIATLQEAARDEAVAARLRKEGPPLDELGERAIALGLTSCGPPG